jgi:hypothetical protein
MKIKLIFLFFAMIFFNQNLSAQEVESIVLKKEQTLLYKGLNQEVMDWYVFMEDSIILLSNLTIAQDEIENWFKIRKDSDNIFRGNIMGNQFKTITFIKRNDEETSLSFYLNFEGKDKLILTSIDDGLVYIFSRMSN